MFSQKPIWFVLLLPVLSSGALLAQRPTSEKQPWEIQRDREKESDDLGKRNMAPLRTAETEIKDANDAAAVYRERLQRAQFEQFRDAFNQFQSARDDLSAALSANGNSKAPARKMEKSTSVFLGFIGRVITQRPHNVFASLDGVSQTDLGEAILKSALRVTPSLTAVIQTENSATVDVHFLTSFRELQSELLRLQWLTQHVK